MERNRHSIRWFLINLVLFQISFHNRLNQISFHNRLAVEAAETEGKSEITNKADVENEPINVVARISQIEGERDTRYRSTNETYFATIATHTLETYRLHLQIDRD